MYFPPVPENSGTLNEIIGEPNDEVKSLDVWFQPGVFQLPKNIDKFFPNLVVINWYNSVIKMLDKEDLKPFPNLIWLSFAVNQLQSLDGNLFQYTQKLKFIDFYQNQLVQIGDDLIKNLTELEAANFRINTCYDFAAWKPLNIENLKIDLPNLCQISTTTELLTTTEASTTAEFEKCSGECAERIENLEKLLKFQGEKIARNSKIVEEQAVSIVTLEKLLREINQI